MKLIVAVNNLGVIGNEGTIPWHSKADFKHFKNLTMGGALICGSNTFETCLGGKQLPGRSTYIVGKDYESLWTAVRRAYDDYTDNIWVIGGSSIYKQLLPLCDEIYISHINNDSPGDTFFEIPKNYRGKIFNYNFDED